MQTCPQCSGSMSPKQTPKGQVFECNQDNGQCLNAKGYPNSVWPKRGTAQNAPPQAQAARGNVARSNGSDDRSNRIERQHSQEMAIRFFTLRGHTGVSTDELKTLIDWFQRDVGRTASATTATPTEGEEVF